MSTPRFSSTAFSRTAFALAPAPNSGGYARMLQKLLPRGKVWFAEVISEIYDLLLGCADELARVEGRALDLLSESDPTTTIELLPEAEAELEIPTDPIASIAERQARIVARLVARQRFRPVDFQIALAPLLGQDAADVVVLERTRAFAISVGDDSEIFRFFVYRNPAVAGSYFVASAQALVNKIKPSHTLGYVIESVSLLCDDPFSLCDRDLLGA